MATAYDTFDMGQSLRDIGNTLVGGAQQRIAMSRDQTDRLAAIEMQRIQQNAQRERDAELNRQYLERMEKQLEMAEKAKERASLNDLKTEYAAKAGVRVEDAEGMDKAALISAIRAIDGTDDQYRLVELAKTEADLRRQASEKIGNMMASQNAQVDRELKKSSLLFKAISDTAGSKAATDWVNGELGIEAIRRELKSKPSKLEALQNAYVAAVAEASSRFTDADGRPIMDPAVLSRVQGLIGRAESVQKAVQTAIQNPNLPAGAVRDAFGAGGAGAQGFERVEGINVDVPVVGRSGDPMSAFMGGRAVGGDGQPQPQPVDPVPTELQQRLRGGGGVLGAIENIPGAVSPMLSGTMPDVGTRFPPVSVAPVQPMGVNPIFNQAAPMPQGVGTMSPALSSIGRGVSAIGRGAAGAYGGLTDAMASSIARRGGFTDPGSAPLPLPYTVNSNAPAMIQGQGTAANPQNNPFVAQQVNNAILSIYGTGDMMLLNRAKQAAVMRLGEQQTNDLIYRAAQGDPDAQRIARQFIAEVSAMP